MYREWGTRDKLFAKNYLGIRHRNACKKKKKKHLKDKNPF